MILRRVVGHRNGTNHGIFIFYRITTQLLHCIEPGPDGDLELIRRIRCNRDPFTFNDADGDASDADETISLEPTRWTPTMTGRAMAWTSNLYRLN